MAHKKCAALLFGAAGLLPSQSKDSRDTYSAEVSQHIAQLELLWTQMQHRLKLRPISAYEWQFFRLRPQNFPTRRIAGMVILLHRFHQLGFLNSLCKIVAANRDKKRYLLQQLIEAVMVEPVGFWRNNYRFLENSSKQSIRDTALVGKERARDIIVNIVLPALYLFFNSTKDAKLKIVVKEIYNQVPRLSENSITKAMQKQLLHADVPAAMVRSASDQQGLIYLHKVYCRPGKCQECLALGQTEMC
jgi:hypothetical protein